ncbi:MAG: hypothetical protein M3Y43_07540 [Pseudomonadota bacterium]|nr:hypothetical protein [Pseudomonadota bacterium]
MTGHISPTYSVKRACKLPSLAVTLLFTALAGVTHAQQSPATQQSLDTIIGTQVQEEEAQAAADPGRVIAAIDKTADSIARVRKTSSLDKVDIVFLADSTVTDGGPPAEIADKVQNHEAEISELRQEIEGNAMLYHALDSRQILMRDVLAVEFDDRNGVIIYAAAKPAG